LPASRAGHALAVPPPIVAPFDRYLSGLTGDAAAVAAVAKAYRVYFKNVPLDQGGYTMDHTAIKLIEVLTTLQKAGYLTVALVSLEKMSGP
jgi:hypothetical protein